MAEGEDVTQLIAAVQDKQAGAADRLLEAVYEELRRLARQRLAGESPGQTLQATALVHEAYLRLVDSRVAWQNRWHFFAAAAEAMRRILIDRARWKSRIRHGGEYDRVDFEMAEGIAIESGLDPDELLSLDEALNDLESYDARKAAVVKLRYFAGLEVAEVAEALEVSPATVKNDWAFARAWLRGRMTAPLPEPGPRIGDA